MIISGFYTLLSLIDYLVYSLVSTMVSINIDIAGKEIFDSIQISEIATKIYIVVGVLMLFKLVISAVQYLINPDAFDDKEKGLVGILKKTAVSIALMVLAPAVFDFMIAIQGSIIEAIPNLVFSANEQADTQTTADNMSYTVLKSFIKVNPGKGNDEITDLESFRNKAAEGCGGGLIGNLNNCKYNYMILVSTLSGVFLCYVLMSMTLDVAIRTIKFSIIRILAPIPISGYVFSKDKLNKFVKTTLTVYFDLFIRLAIIYFIIFAVKTVIDSKMLENIAGNDNWFRNAIVNIAIIGGLFMFAKTAPKFISELLGLPDIGAGDMKDMFKPAWQRAGVLGAGAGMLTAATGNAINKAKFANWGGATKGEKLRNAAKNIAGIAGSATAGAASAGFHGGMAAMQGKDTKAVNAAGYKRAIKARQNRDLDKLNQVGAIDRTRVKMGDMLGIDTKASLAENKQKAYSTLHSDVGAYKKAVMGRIVKNADVSMRTEIKENGALDQLGSLLNQNRATIIASKNRDLINFVNKFEMKTYTDDAGNTKTAWGLKANQTLSYHDLAAIHADATQAGIGSVAGVTGENGALTLLAQKELFTDAMHDRVMRTNGTSMDEINVNSGSTHVDITTVFQAAKQHLAENAVPLGESAESLQSWFSGTVTDPSSPHYGKDFNNMDDTFQKKSAELSGEMSTGSTGREAAARTSLERRNANKDKK